jgi:nucleoside-diphosphate-sugar epimerase
MRVFVAGATGAIGRPLVTRLLAAGHEVSAMTRSPERAAALRGRGVEAVVCDAYDADGVHRAVTDARPEVVVHQLTDLPQKIDPRRYAAAIAGTNRLRRETGPTFVRAARDSGARRLVVQSIAFALKSQGAWAHDETAPLATDAPGAVGDAGQAVAELEETVTGAEGIEGVILRYGFFYGPGTAYGPGGGTSEEIARRRFPVVGKGTGRFSFVHIDDAADATVLALDRGAPGIYHVTDDEPVAARDWIPAMAAVMGAKPPRRVPLWLVKLLVGPLALQFAESRGALNAKARHELGWTPAHPTYREGFPAVFRAGPQAGARKAAPVA